MSPTDTTNIPERLIQNNRPAIQEFHLQERLFQRFNDYIKLNGQLYPNAVRFPDFSVNRERFSEPEDVLLPDFIDWGILAFKFEDIPGENVEGKDTPNETIYSFMVFHCPEPYNYSHSEIRTEINGVYNRNRRIKNKRVKREFRYKLSEKLIILKQPSN